MTADEGAAGEDGDGEAATALEDSAEAGGMTGAGADEPPDDAHPAVIRTAAAASAAGSDLMSLETLTDPGFFPVPA